MIISDSDRKYLVAKIPKLSNVIDSIGTRELLIEIDKWLLRNGFAPPDYYDYNDEGRAMQRVRDRIYIDNVLDRKK
ncbi:MAG: hypothetical protein ACOX78_08515 [Lachnospiraceae bacterium]|jgi:hypothetical protein